MASASLLAEIRPYLSTAECDCTAKRLAAVQKSLQEDKIKEVKDWQKEVSPADIDLLVAGKQSYLYADEAK